MKPNKQKVALALGGITLLGIGALGGATLFPQTITVEKEILKEVPGPTQVVEVSGPVQVKEIVKEVPVDNGNLQIVLEELERTDGNVEYLLDDVEEDELEMIVDRLVLKNEWQHIAFNASKQKLFDELDKETVNGTELDEDEMRSLYIDMDDITFEDIEWDDKDAEVLVPFKLRQDDEKFEGVARVIIRENEFDELVIESISKQ